MNEEASSSAGSFEPPFDPKMKQFKVVLLGEGAVGKSSILLRYTENKFNSKHLSTVQAAFVTKQIFVDGQTIELNVWDTAGQEKFHALGPIYYRDSQGAVLVYDITDSNSFERAQNWAKELRRMLGDSAVLIIVGNKLDLEVQRNIDKSEAISYANSVGALFHECSAKESIDIDIVFDNLSRAMMKKMHDEAAASLSRRRPGSRRSLRVVDDENAQVSRQSKRGCC